MKKSERPNTVAGLLAKRHELIKYREQLHHDIQAVTVDIDHLEAAIKVFDPEDTQIRRQRYAAMHRAGRGESVRFILAALKEKPMTSRALADKWCADRGLVAKESTVSMLRKRIGACLVALSKKGHVRRDGFVLGLIVWRVTSS